MLPRRTARQWTAGGSPASAFGVDAKGNFWVANKGNNRVQKFDQKDEYLGKLGPTGSGNG